jgi:hypothetical protein
VLLGARQSLGVDDVRQRGERAVDHVGLRERHGALAHRGGQRRALAVERGREGEVGPGLGEPGARVVREPARGVLGGRLLGEVAGVGQDAQPQLGQLGLGGDELAQREGLVVDGHEGRVRVGDGLQ